MSALSTGDRRNILVLLAHAAALVAGLWFAWTQWSGVATDEAAARQERQTLEELDRRLRQPGGALPAGKDTGEDPMLRGGTSALAGANLQDRVVSAIRAAGGTVTSSQIEAGARDEAGTAGAPSLLVLTVTFELANDPLQALLYGLESGLPALFLDHLSIDSPDDARNGLLRVSMTVSGFWPGEKHS